MVVPRNHIHLADNAAAVAAREMNQLSNEELLFLDAADPGTKRGGKLDKDKKSALQQAKVWMIFFLLSVIFFISLRVSESTHSDKCE